MKAMKQLLIVIGLMSILSLNAQTPTEYPVAQMHSTSAMVGSGSALPSAATTGVISADDNLPTSSPRGPRRAKGEDDDAPPADPPGPNEYPLGDTPWLLMLLLALGYALYVRRKYGLPSRASRK
ncbi:MAG: hypothetical protein IJ000_06675 [Paludibacteraceae bacterium]|nr:hypothetical protein [Paludibacteraceae bacterium]